MFIAKIVLLIAACLILTATATPVKTTEPQRLLVDGLSRPILARHARSPEGGSVDVTVKKDQNGREAAVNYNHNLYTSNDGRGSIDAYAQGSRNFDHNRNDFSGGIRGSFRF